jgi:hypothetical protein
MDPARQTMKDQRLKPNKATSRLNSDRDDPKTITSFHQEASGSIDVADDHVRLEVFLPWFLAKLVGDNSTADPKGRNVAA